MKKLLAALLLSLSFTAQALPPYGFNMTQADSTGSFFWGYYFIPPTPSASYIFMYDGTGIPSTNPLRMTAIGDGLAWDGTTLTSTVSNAAILAGLGYTPYSAANPNGYIGLAAARAGLSVNTSGANCGTASYNSSTGQITIPTCTPPTPGTFNFGYPAARTLAMSTSYQANDPTKATIVTPSYSCTNATQVLTSSACTVQARVSSSTATCSTGTVVHTQSLTVNLGVLITQNSTGPADIKLPIGAYFILCPTAGTFTTATVEQTAGI